MNIYFRRSVQGFLALAGLLVSNLTFAQTNYGILREFYAGIPGGTVADLTNNASFPNNPTSESIITNFFESPSNVDNNYGQRLRALIIPPVTGDYVFWISSDDASTLFLGSDESPASRRPIASVASWTSARVWTSEAGQQSAAISMVANKKYYIEALMKENGGNDNLAVRWQLPDGTMEEPIPATRLLVYGLGPPVVTQQPSNVSVVEGGSALFSMQVNRTIGMSYQWQRAGTNILNATNITFMLSPATMADNGSRFRCLLSNTLGSTNSNEAILTVLPDTTAPTVVSVGNAGDPQTLSVIFSESVDPITALQTTNYSVDNSIKVFEVIFGGDASTVVLKTSSLSPGITFIVTVNNVKDLASTPNTIAANTRGSFSYSYTPLDMSNLTGMSEPLGPSNRRGGLTISEIMYHPAPRVDGKNLEFIELFNSHDWAENISGFRLAGALEYTFPANTLIPARRFLVVAASPADIQSVYSITNVVGGYANKPMNTEGTIQLLNKNGFALIEAQYSNKPPFPAAADGAGHSLVLARPSYGEGVPQAWAASDTVGGSPGSTEVVRANSYRTVLINEFLAHTDDPDLDYVELFNYSAKPVDISGCILTDDSATNKFLIPAGTSIPSCGFVVFNQNQLGFALSSSGEAIYFISPDQTRIIDAVEFGPQANGVATGRYPDGAPNFHEFSTKTPGAPNSGLLIRDVVINEIMYDPISGDNNDEYIELYNKGTNTIDLSQWRFVDGVDFTIPPNTLLTANGYLVVAKNAARLMSNNANLNPTTTVGNYKGTLSNAGDHLALAMPHEVLFTNWDGTVGSHLVYVVVDEVTYGQGGRWGQLANGGGSSLELINPRSDHRLAANWADSDETAKSAWTTVEYRGLLDNGNGAADSLQVFLLGEGECLVDEVEVFTTAGVNLVTNPNFDSGLSGWFLQGNHRASTLDNTGGVNNSRCLHIRANGRGDTGANRIRTTLTRTLSSGETATLRAKVRWLKGTPEILLRLHGNWLEAPGSLSLPRILGTPGAPNSRAVANAGPAIYNVTHFPALPAANQLVTVRAQVYDYDGLASVVLKYRVDPSTNYASINMVYNGAGMFSAAILGRSAGTLVAYYIQATDAYTPGSTARFPNDAPARECLIRFGDTQPAGNFGSYHLWMTQATLNRWISREKLNNSPLDCTFVYGNQRVIYNMGALYSGSPFTAPGYDSPSGNTLCGYVLIFPPDDLCLGSKDFVLDWPVRDGTFVLEHVAFWICGELGVPNSYRRFINMFVNGSKRGTIYEDCVQPNADAVKAWFPNDSNGDLYKIDDWFEFDNAAVTFSNTDAMLKNYTTTGGAKKLARYRWNWRKRAVQGSTSDYTNLFALVDALNTTGTDPYTAKVEALVNVDEWVHAFAIEHIVANWDSYGYQRGKNMYTYKPENGKWEMLPWDIDFFFSSATNSDLFYAGDPTMATLYAHPPFRRAYYRALYNAAYGPLLPTNISAAMDAQSAALQANGITPASTSTAKTWIEQRRSYVLTQLAPVAAKFAITSNGGNDFSTNRNLLVLNGTAPVAIKTLEVNGIDYAPTWTTVTNWVLRIPLQPGTNSLTLRGYDIKGNLFSNSVASIHVNFSGAVELPEDHLVINEIQYHPLTPNAEFIELFNTSTTSTFDLSRWRLSGASFTFPEGTLFSPQGYVVVAKDPVVFAANYGAGIPVAGVFTGQLSHGGEALKLIKSGVTPLEDQVINEVKYNDKAPWPTNADGLGPSLQLIDASRDNRRVGNWAATTTNAAVKYTPGAANSVRASLPAFPPLWLNEVLANNLVGLPDLMGHREPWVEIYNSGTNALDLSQYFLSDNYSNLTQWAFPTNASLLPGQFLVVWADGKPEETTDAEWHANFRLNPSSGSVALSRLQNGAPKVMDYLNYKYMLADRSYGAYADGQPNDRHLFDYPTPGATNNPASAPVQILINEWMAINTHTLTNPVSGVFDDWFELYNAGSNTVDLADYRLTDDLSNPSKFVIPPGTHLEPCDFLLVWADNGSANDSPITNILHANFKLSQTGETIGLFAPDDTLVDVVTFGAQTNDISEGRWPDGASPPFFYMPMPTPQSANVVASTNRPPVLTILPDQTVDEGALLTFTVLATDPDADQSLRFSLGPGAPTGARMDTNTGVFTWTPTEAQGPGRYSIIVRVTDNGEPNLTSSQRVTIAVNEVNTAPMLAAIPNQTIDEGKPMVLPIIATDTDLPPQRLTYSLDFGSPPGAVIDPFTGVFSWTPTKSQGPGSYSITVRVTDDVSSPLSDTRTFNVSVNDVNAPPDLSPIGTKTVKEGDTLSFTITATDSDVPAQQLTYMLESGAPVGAQLDSVTGLFTWTPGPGEVPRTNWLTIRVTDNGTPPLSASETIQVIVRPVNAAPVLAAIPNQSIHQGKTLSVQLSATDSDIPVNNLSYSLEPGSPDGMSINRSSGILTWTPSRLQVPSTNSISVRVTDDGTPPLSDTKTFLIVAKAGPEWRFISVQGTASSSILYIYLTTPGDVYIDDLMIVPGSTAESGTNAVANGGFESPLSGTWTVSANHAKSEITTNFQHSGKSSLHIVASTGGTTKDSSIFQTNKPALTANAAYTLSYWYLPGTNNVTLDVRLSGFGISSTNVITLPANHPPILAAINDKTVRAGGLFTFTASASDPDNSQLLTYTLMPSAPAGAQIDPVTGVFTWATASTQTPGANSITVKATDDGSPIMSDSKTFTITVLPPPAAPRLGVISATPDGTITINWEAEIGTACQLQYKNTITDSSWTNLGDPVTATAAISSITDHRGIAVERYYRVILK